MRHYYIIAILVTLVLTGLIASFRSRRVEPFQAPVVEDGDTEEKCDGHTCNALDPVMDPKYNMQQIVKQSILLEEHINNERKRCTDCITKHFLHIIGLAEEAVSLDPDAECYKSVPETYSAIFDAWREDNSDHNVPKELRKMRKKLMVDYFHTGGPCGESHSLQ